MECEGFKGCEEENNCKINNKASHTNLVCLQETKICGQRNQMLRSIGAGRNQS